MKRGFPPLKPTAALLALLLLWRLLGAPTSAEALRGLGTEAWQARMLLPSRVARVMRLWLPVPRAAEPDADTLARDGADEYERELAELSQADDELIAVYFPGENALRLLPLESYVCGVVAAEMPARYHLEALKAQAVAARTRAVWQMRGPGCDRCQGAQICADSAHCQGYASAGDCRERWGEEYAAYRDRVVSAVAATAGEILTYDGEPITVMYHAISGGVTEDAQTVFSQALPYLVSVQSEGEEQARGFTADARFSFGEAARLLDERFPNLGVTAEDVRRTLAIADYTPTGRVDGVLLCGERVKATALRAALGLRSTWFTLSMDEQGITFHQRGYGHGVGMSQTGANGMAAGGGTYRDILSHYYTGTTLASR